MPNNQRQSDIFCRFLPCPEHFGVFGFWTPRKVSLWHPCVSQCVQVHWMSYLWLHSLSILFLGKASVAGAVLPLFTPITLEGLLLRSNFPLAGNAWVRNNPTSNTRTQLLKNAKCTKQTKVYFYTKLQGKERYNRLYVVIGLPVHEQLPCDHS